MRKPRILITNDDGIHAPGIRHLCQALKQFADVIVVAPAHEQSAVSLSITLRSPLHLNKIEWPECPSVWSVNGTPADCIKLGLHVLVKEKPDLIVSGINRGTNAGRNILYSGTVAGVIEGIIHDIPGIAFSCRDYFQPDYASAEKHVLPIVRYVLEFSLPEGTLLNVNFPAKSHGQIKGIKLTRQGKEYWGENPDERFHPAEGHSYYWLGAKLVQCEESEDSDVHWLHQGYATAVPVHVAELTDHQHLLSEKERFERFFIS